MAIAVERVGRRSYLTGDTYAVRGAIKSAGGRWDADRKAWWMGDDAKARELAGQCGTQAGPATAADGEAPAEKLADDSRIAGKATYKGREYILVWEGQTRRGQAAKLCFRDGTKVFWAAAGEYQVTKRYDARQDRYGRTEHMTFGRLQSLRAKYARAKAEGNEDGIPNGSRYECEECGEYVTRGQGSCWETGCAH